MLRTSDSATYEKLCGQHEKYIDNHQTKLFLPSRPLLMRVLLIETHYKVQSLKQVTKFEFVYLKGTM